MVCDFENLPDLLSTADLARELGASVQTARSLAHSGKLPSVRIGRRVYVPKRAFSEFIEAQLAGDAEQGESDASPERGAYITLAEASELNRLSTDAQAVYLRLRIGMNPKSGRTKLVGHDAIGRWLSCGQCGDGCISRAINELEAAGLLSHEAKPGTNRAVYRFPKALDRYGRSFIGDVGGKGHDAMRLRYSGRKRS